MSNVHNLHSTESSDYRVGRGYEHLSHCLWSDIYLLYFNQQTSQAFLYNVDLLVKRRSLELRQSCRYRRCSTLLCRRSEVSGLRVSGLSPYSECVELVLATADGCMKPQSFVNVLNREVLYCETLSLTT